MGIPGSAAYFTAVEIDANTALRFVPKRFTAVMMARATPEAMRPYSMAVAPDSSFKKARNPQTHLTDPHGTAPAGRSRVVYRIGSQMAVIYHSRLFQAHFEFCHCIRQLDAQTGGAADCRGWTEDRTAAIAGTFERLQTRRHACSIARRDQGKPVSSKPMNTTAPNISAARQSKSIFAPERPGSSSDMLPMVEQTRIGAVNKP
jgi:hypothetical protein